MASLLRGVWVRRTPDSPCRVFHEDALALQLHEKLSTCSDEEVDVSYEETPELQERGLALTAQVLQDEIELPSSLEGVDQINNERVLHLLQDVPLCFGVGCVLGVTDNHSLHTEAANQRD